MGRQDFLLAVCIGLIAFSFLRLMQSPSVRTGDEARLDPDSKIVLVSADQESFNKLLKAAKANDREGWTDLLVVGKVLSVYPGTKVQVLDSTFTMRRVMILEGSFAGRSGWVLRKFVVR